MDAQLITLLPLEPTAWIGFAVAALLGLAAFAFLRWLADRRAFAAEISALSERSNQITSQCPVGIVLLDSRGLIRGMNPAAGQLFGWSDLEMFGQSILRLMPEATAIGNITDDDLIKGNVKANAFGRRKDGSRFPLSFTAGRIFDGRAAEIRLFVSEAVEPERVEVVVPHQPERIVGRIAGKFDDLLTTINGYSELALHALPAHSPVKKDLEEILVASERASTITRDLLAFSGSQVVPIETVFLNSVARRVQEVFAAECAELSPDTTQPAVLANEERLFDSLCVLAQCMLSRAEKTKTVKMRTSREAFDDAHELMTGELPPGEYGCIVIYMPGVELDYPELASLFEPFGELSTVYGFVRSCVGGLTVDCGPGRGVTFALMFPMGISSVSEDTTSDVEAHG